MADVRTLLSATTYGVAGAFYLYLGIRLHRRRVSGEGAGARRRFGLWWLGLGAHSVIAGLLAALLLVGTPHPWLVAGATYAATVAIATMSYGLLSYMLYLFTGRRALMDALAWVYGALFLAMVAAVAYAGPQGVAMEGWIPILQYARPEGSALDLIASLVFVLPPFVASGAYATLFWRVRDAGKRWRIALTGGALFTWLVASLVLAPLDGDIPSFLGRAVALAAAVCAHLAYTPPAWAQRRYGAEVLESEVVAPPVDPVLVAERRAALTARARELV